MIPGWVTSLDLYEQWFERLLQQSEAFAMEPDYVSWAVLRPPTLFVEDGRRFMQEARALYAALQLVFARPGGNLYLQIDNLMVIETFYEDEDSASVQHETYEYHLSSDRTTCIWRQDMHGAEHHKRHPFRMHRHVGPDERAEPVLEEWDLAMVLEAIQAVAEL